MDNAKKLQELRSSLTDTEKEMKGISDKMVTEKRSVKSAEERTAWDALTAKADAIIAEIADVENEIKRAIAIAKAQGDVISAAAGIGAPGKEELGKSERKNVRTAKVGNFFRAANQALGYKLEGVEKELYDEAAKEFKSFDNLPDFDASKGSLIPAKALRYMSWTEEQFNAEHRDIQATTSALGIELINTETLASNYVQALRPQNALMNAGVRVIQNDSGNNVVFPRENSLYTAAMATTENAAATESLTATAFINPPLTYSPKRGTGFVQVSNQLLLQAGWWEPFLREQIVKGNATLMDVQGINGSGASGQVRGILNTTGTQTVVGGTNGANFARTHITQFESGVGTAGADLNMCKYISNFAVNAYGKRTEFSTGSGRYLVDQGPSWAWGNANTGKGATTIIDQYQAYLSANVPSNLTKGTSSAICSAVIFGDVSKMVYMNFGGLQVIVDPYVNAGTALTNYYVHFWFDFNVILPGAVSFSVDMLTP
jgi:HK97 family phage major capsid protein